jgi:hypothetical protein
MGLCLLFNSPDSRHKSASQDLVGNAITKRAGSIVEIAKAVDKLSERCSAGTPPNVQSAFCRPTASAVKLSPLFVKLSFRSINRLLRRQSLEHANLAWLSFSVIRFGDAPEPFPPWFLGAPRAQAVQQRAA